MFRAISAIRPGEDEPIGVPSSGMTAWHTSLALLFGSAMAVLALILIIPSVSQQFEASDVAIWAIHTGLFVLGGLLINRIEEGSWTGYPQVVALVAWLTMGLGPALAIIIVGAIGVAVLRKQFAQRLDLTPISRMQASSLAMGRIAITGSALITATAFFTAFQFSPPLEDVTVTQGLALVLSLVMASFTAQLVGALLLGELRDVAPRLKWGIRQGRIALEALSIIAVLILTLVEAQVQPALYGAVLILVGAQAIRLRHASKTEHELIRRIEELSVVNRAAEAMASTLVMDELLMSVYRQVHLVTEAPAVYIAFYDAEHDTVEYRLAVVGGMPRQVARRPLKDSAAGHVIVTKSMIHTNRYEQDKLTLQGIQLLPLEQEYPLFLGLPLLVGSEALGALVVLGEQQQGLFDKTTVRVLQSIARQAAVAIHNAALYTRSTELAHHLSLITNSTQNMMLKLDKAEAVRKMCETAMAIAKSNAAALFMFNRAHRTTSMVHAVGLTPAQMQAYAKAPPAHEPRADIRLLADVDEAAEMGLVKLAEQGGFKALAEIPLVLNNAVLGYLTLYFREPHYYSRSEIELLQMLATQVASAIGNADLFGALEMYASEMAQLAHLSRVSTSSLDLNRVAHDVAEILCQILSVTRATVALLNQGDMAWQVVGNVSTADRSHGTVSEDGLVRFPELSQLVTQDRPSVRALHIDQSLSDSLRRLLVANREKSLMIIPMLIGNQLIGTILLGSQDKRQFTEREWQLIEMASNQIGAQLQNARLYTTTHQALKQRLDQLAVIEDIAQQISSTLDFNQIIKNMLEAALRSTQANYGALMLLTEEHSVRLIVIDYMNGRFSRYFTSLSREDSIAGKVIRTGKTTLIRDTRTEPHYVAPRTGMTYLSSLATPLIRDDAVIGVLSVESEQANFFTDEHVSFLSNLAGHAVISIGNARMLEERQYQVKVLTSLQGLALRLSSTVESRSVANTILETTTHIFEPSEASIFRYNVHTQSFTLLGSVRQYEQTYRSAPSMIPPEFAQEAAQTGEVQIVQFERESRSQGNGDVKYATTISVPLKHGNRVHEVLSLAFPEPRNFPKRDLDTLALLASQAAGHLENAMLHEQIRAGNERMAAILNSTRDGVILLDQRGWLIEANPAARRLFGDDLMQYVNDVVADSIWKKREPAKRDTGPLREFADQMKDLVTRRQFDLKTDKGVVYLEEIGSPVVDAHKRPVGWLLVLRDVTEERQLAEYRDEITSMVVHDLRGPLASIISGIYLAQEEISAYEALDVAAKTLSLSSDSANRLMVLVESLLDIAKMEAREMPLRLEVTELGPLIDRAALALDATIQQSHITFHRDIPANIGLIEVDAEITVRIIINLLDNAIRHTPTGKDVLIGAERTPDGKQVLLRIADSGRGIPAEERDHVFEKFKQAKGSVAARGKRGTGLGLTFCRLAVEAHGGRIWVEDSGPLTGASFAFTLPVAARQPTVQAVNLTNS